MCMNVIECLQYIMGNVGKLVFCVQVDIGDDLYQWKIVLFDNKVEGVLMFECIMYESNVGVV